MNSADKYERIEDGLDTWTDPKASEFKPAPDGSPLEILLRDFRHTQKWAKQSFLTVDKAAWGALKEVAWARYNAAWNSEEYSEERKARQTAEKNRLENSFNE